MSSYTKKYGIRPALIEEWPREDLGIVVVIPAHNEPDIHRALSALNRCYRPNCSVEIIVVINASENADAHVYRQNIQTLRDCKLWEAQNEAQFRFYTHMENDMPAKHAGVGMARKIGMDEAVRRFEKIGNRLGIIACFDADSSCDINYLTALETHFKDNPDTPGCSIQFKHPTFGTEYEPHTYLGIKFYELHLRYYNQAIRSTGFPQAYHTIGSSMAVRTDAYQKQGGMNRRKAGEDFYFLHKIIALGNFTELNSTCVYPSPRPSNRVPFGTGKAINDYLKNPQKGFFTYNPKAFEYLDIFFKNIPEFYFTTPELVTLGTEIPYVIIDFLNAYFFDERILEIKRNSSGVHSFEKRFYRWFNAFMILKFVHFVRDNAHPNMRIERAALEFLRKMNHPEVNQIHSIDKLLDVYRELDRKGTVMHIKNGPPN